MPEFDTYRQRYEADMNAAVGYTGKSHDFFTEVKANYLSVLFVAYFGSEQHLDVLDVGCGNGKIHQFLLKRSPRLRIRGVDVAASVIETARTENPQVQYDVYDGVSLPYEANQFDAAYAICVMHHVTPDQWPHFLLQLRRVVRPGGLVSVIEHNPLNPLTRRFVRTCPVDRNAKLLGSSSLFRLFDEAGLTEIKRRFIQFTPFGGLFFERFDRVMGWLPLGAQYLVTGRTPMDPERPS